MTRRSLGGDLAWSTVASVASRAVGALGGVLVARALAPAARGDLAVLVVVATMASIAAAGGVQFWIVREVAATGSRRQPARVAAVHTLATLAVGAVVAIVLAPWVASGPDGLRVLAAVVASAVTGVAFLLVLALPNGERAMGVFAAAMTACSIAYVVGVGALILADRASVAAVLWCGVAGNVAGVVVAARSRHRDPADAHTGAGEPVRRAWGRAVRFGAAGGVGELVLAGMLRVDVLVLALLRPAAEVGYYAIATSLTELLWVVADGTAHVALPAAADDGADRARLPAVFRLATVASLGAAVVLALVARPLIGVVFGTDYAPAASAVPLLGLAAVAGGAWKILSADVIGRRGTRSRLTSALAGITAMTILDLVLVPGGGIVGASAAACAGYAVALALMIGEWRRVTGGTPRDLLGLRRDDLRSLHGSHSVEAVAR